jgi:RNA polymerase sigma-70 factor (ECF subfamily)
MELQAIIYGCIKHDFRCQKMLYEYFYSYALRIVFRYIYSYDIAVNIVNDGFVKLFRNFQKFNSKNAANTKQTLMVWMRKLMVNSAIQELRKKHMVPDIRELPDHIWQCLDSSLPTGQSNLNKDLIIKIRQLSPLYRVVFNMYVIDGFTHQEIAMQLHISVERCKSNLSYAREQLKNAFNKDIQEAGICNL